MREEINVTVKKLPGGIGVVMGARKDGAVLFGFRCDTPDDFKTWHKKALSYIPKEYVPVFQLESNGDPPEKMY